MGGAKFDLDKLNWLNAQTLRDLPAADIAERARPAVEEAVENAARPIDVVLLTAAADLMRERLVFAHDLATSLYLFQDPNVYDEAGLKKRWKPDSARLMALYADRLDTLDTFSVETAEGALRDLAEAEGVGFGLVVHPARLAVTGVTVGAGLFETMAYLGKEACVRRLRRAAAALAA